MHEKINIAVLRDAGELKTNIVVKTTVSGILPDRDSTIRALDVKNCRFRQKIVPIKLFRGDE